MVETTTTATFTTEPPPRVDQAADSSGEICMVDLGRQSRKRIRRLRRGEGKLMRKLEDAIAALKEEGVVGGEAGGVVVLLVREKPSVSSLFGDDDDDDDD